MLDRGKLMRALRTVSDSLFVSNTDEYDRARALWDSIAHDPLLLYKLRSGATPWPLPFWQGPLGTIVSIERGIQRYTAAAVDGSQVYPDRHQGSACFLLNIGSVLIEYGAPGARVHFAAEPYVFTGALPNNEQPALQATEMVDYMRQHYELAAGVALMSSIEKSSDNPKVLLFDGSLIFWHLAHQSDEIKNHFMNVYCSYLQELYTKNVFVAWYISLPKSKDVVNVLRCAAAQQKPATQDDFTQILDTTLAHFFLQPATRTVVFKPDHPLCEAYPSHLAPHFFYMHVGAEVARIELPAWLANNEQAVNTIARVVLDQSAKGQGYPVVLAESHEQAVVKGPDRDFFYHLITKLSIEQQQRLTFSQKSIKKRGLGI